MRRGLVHVLAWSLATGAAVTLSWWGVHTVMAGTAYDPPRALPVLAGDATEQASKALSSATSRPEPSTSTDGGPPKSGRPTATASPSTSSDASGPPRGSGDAASGKQDGSSDPGSGQVKSYDTRGGRAVFDLGDTSATLVTATPAAGWSMQVWKTETWIRVEFGSGADRVSVFCTWHDSAPRVDINTY
ncbi:hypothetical protein ACFY93_31070 [Streptomyces sp. NPDC008313]|uniref:hypothetical protein n=1 Tax=Streptomyces sp. NPDC008313 TaxID=3364826 RepID=UPI0036E7F90C